MWKALAIFCILAFLVLITMAVINMVRKTGSAKRMLMYAVVSLVLAIVGANIDVNSKETVKPQAYEVEDVPPYSIADEQSDKSQRHLRITTSASEESDLRKIVLDIRNKYQTDEAVWLFIHEPDKNPNGKGFGTLIATARFGNTELGTAAAGTKSIEDYFFEKK
ncbi:hypothetical protein [Brevibacillus borstelensis]|uniref:hypothetical protein n=1 Tax=Brevibacillus borstelensis TaxID=45462 RepID=UPI000F07C70E|nr:hypothetical protein [Brevibacillus borstelensis]MED1745736.1 hypothetical protein [Brevibacillus borstelensis]MED1883083.1 hypothetical protein [Brevibacillus borstelensis]RNB55921.1 hypothetical protein EDM54_24435 [Brevibacillus borstelensis]